MHFPVAFLAMKLDFCIYGFLGRYYLCVNLKIITEYFDLSKATSKTSVHVRVHQFNIHYFMYKTFLRLYVIIIQFYYDYYNNYYYYYTCNNYNYYYNMISINNKSYIPDLVLILYNNRGTSGLLVKVLACNQKVAGSTPTRSHL